MADAFIPDRFRDVFYTHYLPVVRKLQALLGEREAAEDIAQETFLRLYRFPPDDMERVGAWLHKTATRLAYDFISQAAKRRSVTEPDTSACATHPASEDEVLLKLDRATVTQALSRLSDRDRQLLLLRHSGYSYREIATTLHVNPETVGTLLARATDRFKREFESEEGGPQDEAAGGKADVARHSG